LKPLVDLGVIKRTKGLGGHVKVLPFIEKNLFKPSSTFFLSPPTLSNKKLTIEAVKPANKELVIKFVELNTIEEAKETTGCFLQKSAEELPSGYIPQSELIGCSVFSKEGALLGKLVQVEETPAYDMYVVKNSKEFRLAAIKEIVLEINLAEKKIIVNLPEGLSLES
jgi:16S rRNA processing protein RimM